MEVLLVNPMFAVSANWIPDARGWPLAETGGRGIGGAPTLEEKVHDAEGRIAIGCGPWFVKVRV